MAIHGPSSKMWDTDVRQAAEEIDAKFPRGDWTSTYPGHGDNGAGYAVDFMCNKYMGDKIANYVWENRKRLGVWYVIWYGRIISETRPNAGWQRYYAADDPNPSKSHKNHVHVSFYPGRKYVAPVQPVTMYTNEDNVKGYDINGKVKYTRKKGYRLTGVPATSSSGKYLVTGFDTWYPWARLSEVKPGAVVHNSAVSKPAPEAVSKPAPEKSKYIGPYVVDPLDVKTTLSIVNHKTGKVVGQLKPRHRITKAVGIETHNGRRWLMDSNGNRYAMDFLVSEKDFLARKPDDSGKA